MVEGPGNKLKGEKMKATVVGQVELFSLSSANLERKLLFYFQVVKSVEGPVAEAGNKKSTDLQKFLGRRVVDVKTLGKELFLIFDQEMCLR